MNKLIYIFLSLILLVGCSCSFLTNTPTKKVEELLNKYRTLDEDITNQIDTVTSDASYTASQKEIYRDIIKKQYKDLTYEIKDETVDGDEATVEVEIEVYDLNKSINKAEAYRDTNPNDLKDNNGTFSDNLYIDYKLDLMKKEKERVKYTISFTLVKIDDEWNLDDLTETQREKIHGIYDYN